MCIIEINGSWDRGCALDKYKLQSIYSEEDELVCKQFDETKTDIGNFIYDIKYNHNYIQEILDRETSMLDVYKRFKEITEDKIEYFLHDKNIDLIIGVPSNVNQVVEPVDTMGVFIAKMINCPYKKYALRNSDKNLSTANKSIILNYLTINSENLIEIENRNILLIDDEFKSGLTLKACTNTLRNTKIINNIYVMAMTKK